MACFARASSVAVNPNRDDTLDLGDQRVETARHAIEGDHRLDEHLILRARRLKQAAAAPTA